MNLRAKIATGIVVAVFLMLAGGLAKLQILDHEELAQKSEANRIRMVPLIPARGKILDREGRTIVENSTSYTLVVIPAEFDTDSTRDRTMQNLAEVLQVDTATVQRRKEKTMVNRYLPVPIKRGISDTTIAILEEHNERFYGVSYQMEQARKYPKELLAECFTGYVLEASREDTTEGGRVDYRQLGIDPRLLGRLVGKEGIEKTYDHIMRGREGTVYKEVSASGKVIADFAGLDPDSSRPGADLILTIDLDLQQVCVEALDTFCCGGVVAIDPRNGEVLAMASYPGYDANIFSKAIPESLWQSIASDLTHPLLNRPLNGLYPPGSTVKLVTVGAALEEGFIAKSTTLQPCTGGYRFGNRVFRCWNLGGHGSLNAAHAVEQSCDVFMYQIGLKLGVDKLSEYFGLCGLGSPSGIDLPGESPGLNPNSVYYNNRYGERGWTRGLALNLSIGQGELLTTPLQLAQFFCGLANGGEVYRPHLLKAIIHPSEQIESLEPDVAYTLPFSQSTLDILMEGMRLVVEGEHGTARVLWNAEYTVAGKTGTAENPHGENHSWFVGFAPFESPEIVVCALVENAGHGSEVAAPVVGKIIRRYMEKRTGQAGFVSARGSQQ